MNARLATLSTFVVILIASAVTLAAPPDAPQNLGATVSGNVVTLSWQGAPTGGMATGYTVFASLSPGGVPVASLPTSGTTLTVTAVPNGVYYVHVRASNLEGASSASNEITVVVPGGGGACATPPGPATNLTQSVSGNVVTLNWTAPVGGCAPTGYIIQAGSSPGLTNLAVINTGAAPGLTVSAPAGTYYVRVLAMNAAGAAAASNEVIVFVASGTAVTLGFDALAHLPDRSTVTTYAESGFTLVTAGASAWTSLTTFGNPAPFIQFVREAAQSTLVGEVTITSTAGETFTFSSVDVYSSVTPIPHEIIGTRGGTQVFSLTGTVPNTFGGFATVSNPRSADVIDTLIIRLGNPATACCSNPVGLDNVVLRR
jgi:hypothetical protein